VKNIFSKTSAIQVKLFLETLLWLTWLQLNSTTLLLQDSFAITSPRWLSQKPSQLSVAFHSPTLLRFLFLLTTALIQPIRLTVHQVLILHVHAIVRFLFRILQICKTQWTSSPVS
jgi:hypothetical protein